MDLKSWGQHLLFDTKLDMIQLIIYDETFWVSCSRKSQKGFYKNPAPKIAIKAAFPAPEIAKICQFQAPKWAKKAFLIFRRRKSPKRGDFQRRKSPFSSRDPLCPYTTRLTARKARSLKSPQGPEPGRPRAHMVHIHAQFSVTGSALFGAQGAGR